MGKGAQWRDELISQLHACRVVLAIVGPTWSTLAVVDGMPRLTERGRHRAVGNTRGIGARPASGSSYWWGARLPVVSELPADIGPMLNRTLTELRDVHWESDVTELIRGLVDLTPTLGIRELGRQLASTRRAKPTVSPKRSLILRAPFACQSTANPFQRCRGGPSDRFRLEALVIART